MDQDALERKLYVIRKRAEAEIAASDCATRPASISLAQFAHHRLQGPAVGPADRQLLPRALRPRGRERALPGAPAFLDKHFPTWQLAHPFRYLCHNGEINTCAGT